MKLSVVRTNLLFKSNCQTPSKSIPAISVILSVVARGEYIDCVIWEGRKRGRSLKLICRRNSENNQGKIKTKISEKTKTGFKTI